MELNFLYLNCLLRFAGLLGLNGLFILEFAVVHYFADGRRCVGRNLDQVEPPSARKILRLANRHYADHFTFRIKNANLRSANLEVYACELCDNSPLFILVNDFYILPNSPVMRNGA
jgi:hypothetical protein